MGKYDLIVLGGGPGGYAAAIRAAQLGGRVALIEKDKIGGTCLNYGCIPTKAILICINLYEKIKKAESFGISVERVSIDFKKVIDRKNEIVKKLVRGIEFLLEKNGVEVIRGTGKVLEPGKIEVIKEDSSKLLAVSRKLILATGSFPTRLSGIDFDRKKFLCSEDLLEYDVVPEKLDIVGGGVIGIHFAMIYSALGTEISVYEALPEILPGVDNEIVNMIKRILKHRKINILTSARFEPTQSCGKTLISIGRTPNLSGLDALGIKMDGKSVWVNEKMETSIPEIYAIGDLVSKKMFAHVAYEQGVIAAENALGGNREFSYDFVPCGIYTHPEIGAVGLTEKEAKDKYPNIKVGKFPFSALGIAQAAGETEGFIKIVSNEKGKILGVHIIGPEANDLIGEATLAVKNGLTIDQLAETFQSHPSYPEGLQEASLSTLKRSLHIPA